MSKNKKHSGGNEQKRGSYFGGNAIARTNKDALRLPTRDGTRISRSRTNPMTTFAEEIWEMILNRVEDSESVHNVFLAYPPFRGTFGKKIPLWLFDQVFPHLLPYLKPQDVRKCTHVCNTWRQVIFQFAENHPTRRPYNAKEGNTVGYQSVPWSSCPMDTFEEKFETIKSIKSFLRIDPNKLNPFIGRAVAFSGWGPLRDDFRELANFATMLLQEYGEHIWHFKIYCQNHRESDTDFFRRLMLNLSLLPNLRSLYVFMEENPTPKIKFILDNQLPPLPHLESLTLDCDSGYPGKVFFALLGSYVTEQLRYLAVPLRKGKRGWFQGTHVHDVLNTNDCQGLRQLQVNSRHCDLKSTDVRSFSLCLPSKGLQKIEFIGWELEGLFENLYGFEVGVLEFSGSPYQLGKYCSKECERSQKCKHYEIGTVYLPKLRTLSIKNHSLYKGYKFLAEIPSLRTLQIEVSVNLVSSLEEKLLEQRNESEYKEMKRYGCHYDKATGELAKWIYQEPTRDRSVFWKLLPGLQTLKVTYHFSKRNPNEDVVGGDLSGKRVFTYRRKDERR